MFSKDSLAVLDIGTAVHQRFQQISWIDEIDIERLLDSWQRTFIMPPFVQEPAVCQFVGSLASTDVWNALSRPEEPVRLWRERRFEMVADNEWVSGTFDRVTIFMNQRGKPQRAVILDYKSDFVADERALDALISRHSVQLRLYGQALSRILNMESTKIDLQLVFTVAGRVCPAPW